MISTFTSADVSNPLIQYLMLEDRRAAPVPLKELRQKAKAQAAADFQTFRFRKDGRILDPPVRAVLCSFLDFMWDSRPSDSSDLRLRFSEEAVLMLLSFASTQ
ncbi:unnamed protein product, partial [Effrenium voratum]